MTVKILYSINAAKSDPSRFDLMKTEAGFRTLDLDALVFLHIDAENSS